jgi:hypothetical protein
LPGYGVLYFLRLRGEALEFLCAFSWA